MIRICVILFAFFPAISQASDFGPGVVIYIFLGLAAQAFLVLDVISIIVFVKMGKYWSKQFAKTHAIVGCIPGVAIVLFGLVAMNFSALLAAVLYLAVGYMPMYLYNNYYRVNKRS